MSLSSTIGPYQDIVEDLFNGRSNRARTRLLELGDRSQSDPRWWIWMAAASETPMAGLACLRNALRLDPADELAQVGLSWIEGLIRRGEPAEEESRLRPAPRRFMDRQDLDSDPTGDYHEPHPPRVTYSELWMGALPEPEANPHDRRLAPIRATDPPIEPRREPDPHPHPIDGRTTILVVDDSEDVSRQVEATLGPRGYRVVHATQSLDALPSARRERPALILIDAEMSRIDGYRICKLLKTLEETRRIPVILVGDSPASLDHHRGRLAGCSSLVMAPLDPEILIQEVDCALRSVS